MSRHPIHSFLNAWSGVGLHAVGWVLGPSFSKTLTGMKSAQWLPAEQLAGRQNDRIAAMLAYAVSRVPFYRPLGRKQDAVSAGALLSFPVLNKGEIRGRLEDFVAEGVPDYRKISRRTSGSTGEPFLHYLDRDVLPTIYASHLFYDSWFDMRPFDRYLRVVSRHPADDPVKDASWWLKARHRCMAGLKDAYEALTQEVVPVLEVGREQIDVLYRKLTSFRPDFVLGYTSTMAIAAEYLAERARPLSQRVRGVITIGETLTPSRRKLIESYFQAPVINRYGLREFGAWSAQNCPASPNAFHINTEMVAVEILRKDGRPAAPGESGHVVITDLLNRVMPLIRYDTGDVAMQGDGGRCACGRGFPRFGLIEGRTVESLQTPSGKVVSSVVLGRYLREGGPAFEHSDHLNFIRHYQAIQDDSLGVCILVVPAAGFEGERKARLGRDIARLLGDEVPVKIEEVREIPLELSGKRPLIRRTATLVGQVG